MGAILLFIASTAGMLYTLGYLATPNKGKSPSQSDDPLINRAIWDFRMGIATRRQLGDALARAMAIQAYWDANLLRSYILALERTIKR